jgi:hypothetical protein
MHGTNMKIINDVHLPTAAFDYAVSKLYLRAYRRMVGWLVNQGVEAAVIFLKLLSRNSPEGTEEDHEAPQVHPVPRARLEQVASRTKVRDVTS